MKNSEMANNYFSFKQFTINQDKSVFKVGTDGVLLGAYADLSGVNNILDIGSGTGLISIMFAQRSNATITAIEPDNDSFIQSVENIRNVKWNSRIKIIHTNLQNFNSENEKFDLIATNPPYFCDSLKSPDPRKSSARHNDSLTTIDILEGAGRLLKEDGRLQLIMPYVEGNIFIADAVRFGFYCNNILKIRPLPKSEIRRLILTFSRKRTTPGEKFLTIEHGRHQFTEEYINLTKDFYLNF
jgi:tRNA1Val (adenine37-N6)-methyltransferase